MSPGTVVVVGGTGAVGRELVTLLAAGPHDVVVVGRDGERATAVAAAVARCGGGSVAARRADVTDPADRRAAVAGAEVVVTCVERDNAAVARAALDEGAHVVDISASTGVLAGIEALDPLARWHRRSAVVGVGLAPGLTNLLARACVDHLPEVAGIDITILLGLGERHGADAVRWTIDALAAPPRSGAARPRRVAIPGSGTRTAHPFPFADQHALHASLGIPVTTRLCFDSRALTAAAFALRPALRRLPRDAVARVATRTRVGSDRYAVTVTASAPDGRTVDARATGHRQSHATAVVAAHVVRELRAGSVPPGAHHIDQAVDVPTALAEVAGAGVTLHLASRPAERSPARA